MSTIPLRARREGFRYEDSRVLWAALTVPVVTDAHGEGHALVRGERTKATCIMTRSIPGVLSSSTDYFSLVSGLCSPSIYLTVNSRLNISWPFHLAARAHLVDFDLKFLLTTCKHVSLIYFVWQS